MSGLETIKLLQYGKCYDVFLAEDSIGNRFAVKRFYRHELEKRKEYVNRNGKLVKKNWFEDFKRALEVQKVLDHESCIKLHGVFGIDFSRERPTFEEEIELVFEYAEFGCLMDLESFHEEVPNFPKPVVKCIAKDLLSALLYLSEINVAHRDLKPNNIFMNSRGRCKLGDFGESEFMTDGKVKGSKGTYYFLAPEVFDDNSSGNDGSALDMWALGITLWILYFRSFPFYCLSGSIYETMTNIENFDFDTQIKTVKLVNSHENQDNSGDKLCNSNDKSCNSNDKSCNSNDKSCNSDDKSCNSDDKLCNSNDGMDENECNSVDQSVKAGEDLGSNSPENWVKEDAREFINLLEKMLEKDPEKRIKAREALNHEWLRNVDYEAAREYCRRNIKN